VALGSTQALTEMSTRNLPGGKGRPARPVRLTTLPPSVSRLSRESVGAWTSHNRMGLHGLLQGVFMPMQVWQALLQLAEEAASRMEVRYTTSESVYCRHWGCPCKCGKPFINSLRKLQVEWRYSITLSPIMVECHALWRRCAARMEPAALAFSVVPERNKASTVLMITGTTILSF
jgi:hypothetical protein